MLKYEGKAERYVGTPIKSTSVKLPPQRENTYYYDFATHLKIARTGVISGLLLLLLSVIKVNKIIYELGRKESSLHPTRSPRSECWQSVSPHDERINTWV